MPPICSSFLILGLVLTSAVAQTWPGDNQGGYSSSTSNPTTTQQSATTQLKTSNVPGIGNPNETTTSPSTEVTFSVTPSEATVGVSNINTAASLGTSNMTDHTPSPATPTKTARTSHSTPPKEKGQSMYRDLAVAVIIVVTLVAILALGLTCFCTRRRSRKFSVDLNSRHDDDAQIPLSTVDPDITPVNGMQTSDRPETTAEGPKDSEEEQKGEADKPAGDAGTGPPAPSPSPASSTDKLGEGRTDEASPKEQNPEEKTDDDKGVISNKTSVESLKDPGTNENSNNNKAAQTAAKGMMGLIPTDVFFELPLDSPV